MSRFGDVCIRSADVHPHDTQSDAHFPLMKTIRSLFKFHKRTTSTASTERPSKSRTETPTLFHIGKAEPSNDEVGRHFTWDDDDLQ
ncbi:hypothetical protein Hypma_008364 [Hypsizygus marmoreus]|uniref:Uncharacterized protein n=1 Tax=Hypsizygus marmoreus TaxID=39966 RepID=A0A369JSV8_HYPMA|nr:hypothetical protein Hypma_008364 [Hypsizygus marmoreus]